MIHEPKLRCHIKNDYTLHKKHAKTHQKQTKK